MNNLVFFGGTGFIGSHLIELLKNEPYRITVVSRNPDKYRRFGNEKISFVKNGNISELVELFEQAGGIVNLAGESVSGKWTKRKKEAIRNSRLKIDRQIVEAFEKTQDKPSFIVQGSGIGIYGTESSDRVFTEDSHLGGTGFLTTTGIMHEKALQSIENKTRVIYVRTGLVFDAKGGVLPQYLLPFRLFLGGPMGSGQQWMSWIHILDEVRAIRFLMNLPDAQGPYNLTSSDPIRQKEFAHLLGKYLHRPSLIRTPSFFLKMMLGQMADELILNGKQILPQRLISEGFVFKYPFLEDTLKAIITMSYNEKQTITLAK